MKFRKKPVVIEAVQFFKDGPLVEHVNFGWPKDERDQLPHHLDGKYWVSTLEGPLMVSNGDWIITGTKNERYPCKPDIFESIYDRVEE